MSEITTADVVPPETAKESDVQSNEIVSLFLFPSYGYQHHQSAVYGSTIELGDTKDDTAQKTLPPKGGVMSTTPGEESSSVMDSDTSFASAVEEIEEGNWQLNVKGWICIEKPGSLRKRFVVGISRMLTVAPSDGKKGDYLDERAGLFFSRGLQTVNVRIAVLGLAPLKRVEEVKKMEMKEVESLVKGKPVFLVTTQPTGLFSLTVDLGWEIVKKWREDADPAVFNHSQVQIIAYKCAGNHSGACAFSTLDLIPDEGVSLISDLDDTIKESDVHMGKRAAIKSAFYGDGIPVPGMSDAYQYFRTKDVAIHYVSASPYQLFPTILNFMISHHFPLGSLNLRDVWAPGNLSTRSYKIANIKQILEHFPKRKFVFVGDSGEKDAEISAALYGAHPDRFLKIFIRDVTMLGPGGEKREAADQRHSTQLGHVKSALKELPSDKWTLFESSEALLVDEVLKVSIAAGISVNSQGLR
ncbi:hypothetical protein HDU67_002612 [Dinochytrium kinnereticum]|nr:hypothetical protein HDU67_002612 [Dinochytrium kinnereticum]